MAQALKELVLKKDALEEEIKELIKSLELTPVGVKGPLTDRDGFPRNDIDVNAIREMRHDLVCKQNDHINLMKQIEKDMAELHTKLREQKEKERAERGEVAPPKQEEPKIEKQLDPFVKVNRVDADSPAERAGLHEGDEITQFGSVDKDQVTQFGLKVLSELVQRNVGNAVMIKVLRRGQTVTVRLIPQRWSGVGFLGCHLLPI
jgi:26S proteasome non-ATPase regulatory subunit 9